MVFNVQLTLTDLQPERCRTAPRIVDTDDDASLAPANGADDAQLACRHEVVRALRIGAVTLYRGVCEGGLDRILVLNGNGAVDFVDPGNSASRPSRTKRLSDSAGDYFVNAGLFV